MGFLNFLKKEGKREVNKEMRSASNVARKEARDELAFGKPSANNIPPPPTQADYSVDPFAKPTSNADNPFMSEQETSNDVPADPFANNNPSFEETTSSQPGEDLSREFDPQEPDSFMERNEEDFGPVQDYDWSHAEVISEEVHAPQTTPTPERVMPVVQEQPEEVVVEEDYSLPELPGLPAEAEEETLGVHLKEEAQEQTVDTQVLSQKFKEQTTQEETEKTYHFVNDDDTESDEESLKGKPPYLREDKKEIIPKEFFIEAHEFYDTLQEIKAFKKVTKDCDVIAVGWEKTQEHNEKKMNSLIEHVDTVQEDLMKIDAIMFER